MIKKIIVSMTAILLLSVSAFAVDFSVGATVGGWGPTFGRGSDWKKNMDDLKSGGLENVKQSSLKHSMAFAPVFQVMGQVDIIPYFGIELGIGYSMKSIGVSFKDPTDGKVNDIKYSFNQLSIPVLLKGQYEIADVVNVYLGVGPKFNFNVSAPTTTEYTDGKKDDATAPNTNPTKMKKEEYNMFDMDLTFALGAEYKIAGAHYVGLRVAYDMNLLGSLKKVEYDATTGDPSYSGRQKTYVDDLAISLTYRYKFGA